MNVRELYRCLIVNTKVLTLIRLAGGIYDPETLNRYNSKWPEVNIFLIVDLFLTNALELYLVQGFYI
jgi:hypothetical protein